MNKTFQLLLISALASCMMVSCSTIEEAVVKKEVKSRTIDYYEREITKQSIYQKPLVADLDVSKQKLSFTRTYEKVSVGEAKDYVSAEFSMDQNCDVIVHPIYETVITNTDGVTKVDVTITGYPAFYRNIRNFETKDVSSWQIYSYFTQPAAEVKEEPDTASVAPIASIPEQVIQKAKGRSRTRFGMSADYALLPSPDKDYWKPGIGGSLLFITPLSKRFYYTMNVSYLNFAGKYVDSFGGTTDPFHFASANLGFRYTSPIHLYAEVRAGYGELMYDDGNGQIAEEGGFNYAYSLGFHYKSLDLSVRKEKTNNIDLEFTGLRLGIYF